MWESWWCAMWRRGCCGRHGRRGLRVGRGVAAWHRGVVTVEAVSIWVSGVDERGGLGRFEGTGLGGGRGCEFARVGAAEADRPLVLPRLAVSGGNEASRGTSWSWSLNWKWAAIENSRIGAHARARTLQNRLISHVVHSIL